MERKNGYKKQAANPKASLVEMLRNTEIVRQSKKKINNNCTMVTNKKEWKKTMCSAMKF